MYLNYIKEKQVELYREDKIKALYEHITTKHTNYQVEAESRCSLRKMMTHENEWSTKDKMKVIQSRLTLLSQLTRALLEIGEKKDVYKGKKNVGKQKVFLTSDKNLILKTRVNHALRFLALALVYRELDEKMRDVFHSFLEERGVNESLFPFLQAWFKSVGTYESESESEEYILDEGDDDDDLEEEHETQVHPEAEPEVKKAPEVPAPPKEPERQLSKKELKQKEQAEFSRFWSLHPTMVKKTLKISKKRKKENTVGESKASKKKKKKDKQKEVKESQDEVKTNSDAAAEEQEETSSSMFIKEGVVKGLNLGMRLLIQKINWGGGFPRKMVQCNVFERAKGEVALTASGGLRQLPGLTETFEIAALVCVHYDGLLDGKCLLGVIGGTRGKNKRSACTSARSDLRSWLKNNKTGSSCPSSLCDFMHG
ncbi:hypothetical protein DY000_02036758 [Brassica cretica]|uniref:Uncharacterized protein n=1 Tax=Brassica cretica TaxID=69181 RepID=A0ABQ7BK51_BRACR|nr:hypothetical protein DY000_02036758 [Brassica cretica]